VKEPEKKPPAPASAFKICGKVLRLIHKVSMIKRYEWAFSNRLIRDISANVKLVMTVFNQKHLAGVINKE
jgi:hypothetical protein